MSHPRIEEVSDSGSEASFADDPEEMDLDTISFSQPPPNTSPPPPNATQLSPAAFEQLLSGQTSLNPQTFSQLSATDRDRVLREQKAQSKNFQCIYPVYFDATRSRVQGRRVKRENAVKNPLAREIVDALQAVGKERGVGLQIVFEPSKTHPKDWANPGRVKVLVKEGGKAVYSQIANKHHLYTLISAYLLAHPTTESTPHKFVPPGLPMPKEKVPVAVPRGFKMGSILPLHSPAQSGGGVSENFLQDMMKEMGGQGQLPEGMEGLSAMMGGAGGGPSGGGGGVKKVKEKKGKK